MTFNIDLSFICPIFDPLGLATSFTLCVKLMFQQACKNNVVMSDPLDKTVADHWMIWIYGTDYLA